ncbi:hypothetical protein Btru_076346 [Bulinus truncatus]|nr:hypothetical protein Btru_076346 [Bulinus truncatus]
MHVGHITTASVDIMRVISQAASLDMYEVISQLPQLTCTRSYNNCLSRHTCTRVISQLPQWNMYEGHITTASVDMYEGHITSASVDMYEGNISTASVDMYEGHITSALVDMYEVISQLPQ